MFKSKKFICVLSVIAVVVSIFFFTITNNESKKAGAVGYVQHNFTTNGTNSNFFTIKGKLSTTKGTVTLGSNTFTTCLKMESTTKITFKATTRSELVLFFNDSSKDIKIDGEKYSITDGKYIGYVGVGTHTITKASSSYLYFIELYTNMDPLQTITPTATIEADDSVDETTLSPACTYSKQ